MMASSSTATTSSSGVPPGFRFHPTDEELLLYYLKKKVSFEKFDIEVIREVDLNKTEPWDLHERCRIGATPQNEWYFFSHKDRKYPTGSRTNRATSAGFWKATGRDKCIRTTYKKIGMRKTLVFYRGRAPHGHKTDWIMHEYRFEESDDPPAAGSEDGWVVCRVFKKKCFFKATAGEGCSSRDGSDDIINPATATRAALAAEYLNQQRNLHLRHHNLSNLYKPTNVLTLHYPHLSPAPPPNHYTPVQVQDLLASHRPPTVTAYHDFSVLPGDCEPLQQVGEAQRNEAASDQWAVLDNMEGRFSGAVTVVGAAAVEHMHQMAHLRGDATGSSVVGERNLRGYGK